MRLEEIKALALDDQVTVLIGRLTREAVNLEAAVRQATESLGQVNAPSLETTQKFSDVVTECKRRVRARCSGRICDDALAALKEVKRVYDERGRFVHDLVLQSEEQEGDLDRVRLSVHPKATEEQRLRDMQPVSISVLSLQGAVTDTLHAKWRVRALAHCVLDEHAQRTHWLDILRGKGRTWWDGTLDWSR